MIKVESLTKKYAGFTAVDNISFQAETGRVTGFLGPNGAGKSTSMRVMVGLTPPTSGGATINGQQYADLPNPGLEVGVLLDASAQHAGRTGREILRIAQRTMGLPKSRVDEMLDLVSLTGTEAERRVSNYSLGMRQRLGIATALIGDPEVLILDEPANGLDPGGIRWMRDLLRGFANRGGTVLLSSHLLHEIEVIADDIVVIGNGRIVAKGSKQELLAAAGTLVRSVDDTALARALEASGIVTTFANGTLRADATPRHGRQDRLRRRRPAHGTAGRGERGARGDVPRAHLRHSTRRSSGMTAIAVEQNVPRARVRPAPIPRSRLISVELQKMFDTRSGFWLMASILITSVLATGAVILWAPDSELTYSTFATAIGFPMAVILPMIAVLSVTSEWSQRSGLTTFTLVPHRGRVISAKAIAAIIVGVVSMLIAMVVGAVGNVLGTA